MIKYLTKHYPIKKSPRFYSLYILLLLFGVFFSIVSYGISISAQPGTSFNWVDENTIQDNNGKRYFKESFYSGSTLVDAYKGEQGTGYTNIVGTTAVDCAPATIVNISADKKNGSLTYESYSVPASDPGGQSRCGGGAPVVTGITLGRVENAEYNTPVSRPPTAMCETKWTEGCPLPTKEQCDTNANMSGCDKLDECTKDPQAAGCPATVPDPTEVAEPTACGDVGGVFGWIICEAASIVDDFATFVETELRDLLKMPELAPDSEVYTAWSSIRTLATSVLVLVALFAIAAQIFNLDFVSAYTMRKIIPRIIIATILLYTSYFLAGLMILFVNALGDGIAAIIMGPFGDLLEASNNGAAIQYILAEAGITGGQAAGGIGILVGAGAVAFVGVAGIGGIIIAVALVAGAIIVAFITLVLRKVFILGLVMIMPLAIVAWILPNTQKWATSWWNMFSKLLFMYPLVVGLLAVGRVAAYLIAVSSDIATNGASINWYFAATASAQGSLVLIMILIAYFGPYYFIPSMFKTAGGVFAKISSSMDGYGKKYGRKAGEKGGSAAKGWSASQYKAGATGFAGRSKNAFARTATGNIMPTTKSKMKTAGMGAAYSKERNEAADFLVKNAYANKDFDSGGTYLHNTAMEGGAEGDAALREIVARGRYDLLDGIPQPRLQAYAQNDPSFGGSVGANRKDLLSPAAKIGSYAPKDIGNIHDSFWGKADDQGNLVSEGANVHNLNQGTIDQIRGDRELYNNLGAAGKAYINSIGGPTFAGAPGATPGNVTTPTPTTPSGAPVGTVAPVNTADLQNALRSATGGTGNVAAASDGQLRALYAATAKSQDPVVQQTHIDLRNEVVSRGSVTGALSMTDIQTMVNGAIGPDGSRGIQHLSDTDLNRVLSSTHGSTDTTAQAFREAADQEYIKRSGLPPQN